MQSRQGSYNKYPVLFLLTGIFVVGLIILLIYIPRHNQVQIIEFRRKIQELQSQLLAYQHQLTDLDNTSIKIQQRGAVRDLSSNFAQEAKSIKITNISTPNIISDPFDHKSSNLKKISANSMMVIKASQKALDTDIKSLAYEAQVWGALANFLEYPPVQDLSGGDKQQIISNQSAAADGIEVTIQKINKLPHYDDVTAGQLNELLDVAATSAKQDSSTDFINKMTEIQTKVLQNRKDQMYKTIAKTIPSLNDSQHQLGIILKTLSYQLAQ